LASKVASDRRQLVAINRCAHALVNLGGVNSCSIQDVLRGSDEARSPTLAIPKRLMRDLKFARK
jgi:hypothetical protein